MIDQDALTILNAIGEKPESETTPVTNGVLHLLAGAAMNAGDTELIMRLKRDLEAENTANTPNLEQILESVPALTECAIKYSNAKSDALIRLVRYVGFPIYAALSLFVGSLVWIGQVDDAVTLVFSTLSFTLGWFASTRSS